MNYAPIALFTYSRADHTKAAVESLLRNAEACESDLYIFSDGPKTVEKVAAVAENRRYIHTITGFKSINIVERDKNWGLANSLIAGITDVINKYGRIIVVEDDLVLSPYFLKFMNDGLDKYEKEEKISAISAYCPVKGIKMPETYFLRYFHCWGWATWKRGWELMNLDAKELLRKLRWKTHKFNIDGSINNYGMLYCQKVGLVDSWFIRLYASFFLAGKLTLFPGRSLVSNHGLDGSGTHCTTLVGGTGTDKVNTTNTSIEVRSIPLVENLYAFYAFRDSFLKSSPKESRTIKKDWETIKSFIRRLLFIDCM